MPSVDDFNFLLCLCLVSTSQCRSPIRTACSPWFPPCPCTTCTSCYQSRSTDSSMSAPTWSPSKTCRVFLVSHINLSQSQHKLTSCSLSRELKQEIKCGSLKALRSGLGVFTVSNVNIKCHFDTVIFYNIISFRLLDLFQLIQTFTLFHRVRFPG